MARLSASSSIVGVVDSSSTVAETEKSRPICESIIGKKKHRFKS